MKNILLSSDAWPIKKMKPILETANLLLFTFNQPNPPLNVNKIIYKKMNEDHNLNISSGYIYKMCVIISKQ